MVYTIYAKPIGRYPHVDFGEPSFPSAPELEDVEDGLPTMMGPKAGVPVYGGVLPKIVRWDEPDSNPPPDFDNSPALNVSKKAKLIIEKVEPDVHQFFPVDYIDRRDQPLGTRYWFNICNRRDSIHPTASNMLQDKWGRYMPPLDAVRQGMELPSHVDPARDAEYVIDQCRIGDVHMWREPRADGMPLMSEKIWSAIQEAGLSGLAPQKVSVV